MNKKEVEECKCSICGRLYPCCKGQERQNEICLFCLLEREEERKREKAKITVKIDFYCKGCKRTLLELIEKGGVHSISFKNDIHNNGVYHLYEEKR